MNGHNASCECGICLVADMNRHLASIGFEGAGGGELTATEMNDYSVRTRYATPGTRTGRGIVRKVSDAQVKYMLFLFKSRDTSGLVRLPGSENIESMSLRGARDLIDRLLACPELPKASVPVSLATEKQLSFIDSLISSKECPEGSREWFDAKRSEITRDSAKAMIERLLKLANKTVKNEQTGNAIPNGRYAIENADGELRFYHIRTSKAGRQYVCVMASDNEIYLKNGRSIIAEIAKDAESAMLRYGREIGACGHCGRTLTDESSREAGIGPICASKAF